MHKISHFLSVAVLTKYILLESRAVVIYMESLLLTTLWLKFLAKAFNFIQTNTYYKTDPSSTAYG